MQRDEPSGGSLYLVGTPIGHLGDLSPRARDLLRSVDVIACEDTRHSGQLLSSLGAGGRKLSFHQHNTRTRVPQLLDLLAEGQSLAVISDAGLPGISDPGEELVAAAHQVARLSAFTAIRNRVAGSVSAGRAPARSCSSSRTCCTWLSNR